MFTATRSSQRRRAAAALAAACLSLSATPALAADTVGDTQAEFGKPVSAQQPKIGDTPAEFGKHVSVQQPRIGDTPAEFGKQVSVQQPRIGDTPAEFGESVMAPHYVEVVKPERTIIRDTDPALPIVLSGLALLVAAAGVALPRRRARVH